MAKTGISKPLRRSTLDTRKMKSCRHWHPTREILNTNHLAKAVAECLVNNDPEGVLEVVSIYLETANMVKMAQKSQLSRATLYHTLKYKNPTIKTLAKIIHATAA